MFSQCLQKYQFFGFVPEVREHVRQPLCSLVRDGIAFHKGPGGSYIYFFRTVFKKIKKMSLITLSVLSVYACLFILSREEINK